MVVGRPLDGHIWRTAKIQARAWDRDSGWMPWSRTQGSQSAVAEMTEEATGKSSGGGASGLSAALVTSPQEGKLELLTKAPILRWDLFNLFILIKKSETKPF